MSLAGTKKFNGTIDVIWESKEKEEQQIVTDYIVRSLQTSVSNLRISEIKTVKAGNVLHLKTDITAQLKLDSLNLKRIIQNLHPTPAVCGFSKEKAKQFILESENYDREYYTGFLGELNFKKKKSRNSNRQNVEKNAYASIKNITNLFVNLRCMQLNRNEVTIYVGGGITHDSIPENEWEETVSKSGVIKSIL
jgi:isochorismate synthase